MSQFKQPLAQIKTIDLINGGVGTGYAQQVPISLPGTFPIYRIGMRLYGNWSSAAGGGANGTVINRGSAFGQLRKVYLKEGDGTPFATIDPLLLTVQNQMFAPAPMTDRTRITTDAIGTTAVDEYVDFHFANPLLARPRETALRTKTRQNAQDRKLQLILETQPDAGTGVIFGGTRAHSWDHLNVDVTAEVDDVSEEIQAKHVATGHKKDDGSELPLFRPVWHLIGTEQINAAVADHPLPLVGAQNRIAALVIKTSAANAEVNDQITNFKLSSDAAALIGRDSYISWRHAQLTEQGRFAGQLSIPGYSCWMFAKNGQLAQCVDPRNHPNLKLTYNGQPSVAFANAPYQVDVWALEMVRVTGATKPKLPAGI